MVVINAFLIFVPSLSSLQTQGRSIPDDDSDQASSNTCPLPQSRQAVTELSILVYLLVQACGFSPASFAKNGGSIIRPNRAQ
jgi:hypothetical protein